MIKNFKPIIDNSVLLLIAGMVGLIVSSVAQIFMIVAKDIFAFLFNNKDFVLTIEVGGFSLNLIPLLICIPSSLLVALLMYF